MKKLFLAIGMLWSGAVLAQLQPPGGVNSNIVNNITVNGGANAVTNLPSDSTLTITNYTTPTFTGEVASVNISTTLVKLAQAGVLTNIQNIVRVNDKLVMDGVVNDWPAFKAMLLATGNMTNTTFVASGGTSLFAYPTNNLYGITNYAPVNVIFQGNGWTWNRTNVTTQLGDEFIQMQNVSNVSFTGINFRQPTIPTNSANNISGTIFGLFGTNHFIRFTDCTDSGGHWFIDNGGSFSANYELYITRCNFANKECYQASDGGVFDIPVSGGYFSGITISNSWNGLEFFVPAGGQVDVGNINVTDLTGHDIQNKLIACPTFQTGSSFKLDGMFEDEPSFPQNNPVYSGNTAVEAQFWDVTLWNVVITNAPNISANLITTSNRYLSVQNFRGSTNAFVADSVQAANFHIFDSTLNPSIAAGSTGVIENVTSGTFANAGVVKYSRDTLGNVVTAANSSVGSNLTVLGQFIPSVTNITGDATFSNVGVNTILVTNTSVGATFLAKGTGLASLAGKYYDIYNNSTNTVTVNCGAAGGLNQQGSLSTILPGQRGQYYFYNGTLSAASGFGVISGPLIFTNATVPGLSGCVNTSAWAFAGSGGGGGGTVTGNWTSVGIDWVNGTNTLNNAASGPGQPMMNLFSKLVMITNLVNGATTSFGIGDGLWPTGSGGANANSGLVTPTNGVFYMRNETASYLPITIVCGNQSATFDGHKLLTQNTTIGSNCFIRPFTTFGFTYDGTNYHSLFPSTYILGNPGNSNRSDIVFGKNFTNTEDNAILTAQVAPTVSAILASEVDLINITQSKTSSVVFGASTVLTTPKGSVERFFYAGDIGIINTNNSTGGSSITLSGVDLAKP